MICTTQTTSTLLEELRSELLLSLLLFYYPSLSLAKYGKVSPHPDLFSALPQGVLRDDLSGLVYNEATLFRENRIIHVESGYDILSMSKIGKQYRTFGTGNKVYGSTVGTVMFLGSWIINEIDAGDEVMEQIA